MIELKDAKGMIGEEVVYRPAHPGARPELGEITSVSEKGGMVFVRYQGDKVSRATRPADLEWPETTEPL